MTTNNTETQSQIEQNNPPNQEINQQIKRIRRVPIPVPSTPKQYRAIGLIKGKYQETHKDELTQGNLFSIDGQIIDAVILGRLISLIRNHLDLQQDHLWVVYPRTRQTQEDLHVQLVGVWEPETLNKNNQSFRFSSDEESFEFSSDEASLEESNHEIIPDYGTIQENYFSIRGEVIFYSDEEEKIIVKIQQIPRKKIEPGRYFKLELKGTLPGKPVGNFWNFEVDLIQNKLIVREAVDLGFLPQQKQKKLGKDKKKFSDKNEENEENKEATEATEAIEAKDSSSDFETDNKESQIDQGESIPTEITEKTEKSKKSKKSKKSTTETEIPTEEAEQPPTTEKSTTETEIPTEEAEAPPATKKRRVRKKKTQDSDVSTDEVESQINRETPTEEGEQPPATKKRRVRKKTTEDSNTPASTEEAESTTTAKKRRVRNKTTEDGDSKSEEVESTTTKKRRVRKKTTQNKDSNPVEDSKSPSDNQSKTDDEGGIEIINES